MLDCIITETKDIEPVIYEWGGVKWVANNDLAPGCEQSFGLVHPSGKDQPRTLAHGGGRDRVHAPGGVRRAPERPELEDRAWADALHSAGREARGREQGLGAGSLRLLLFGEHARHALRQPDGSGRATAIR